MADSTSPRPRPFLCVFAAGDGSHAVSGLWRVWASKKSPDLYIAAKSIGQIHASVHCPSVKKPTWKRHFGFDLNAKGTVADAVRAEGSSRHKATWCGASIGLGRTIEWRVFVLETALRKIPLPAPGETRFVSPPKTGQCLIFAVILGSADDISSYPKASNAETYLLAEGHLCDGRRVWITYCYTAAMKIPIPINPSPRLFGSTEAIRSAPSELRAFLIADNSDGSLVFWDCRMENKHSSV